MKKPKGRHTTKLAKCEYCGEPFISRWISTKRGFVRFCCKGCSTSFRHQDNPFKKESVVVPIAEIGAEQVTEDMAYQLIATEALKQWLTDMRRAFWKARKTGGFRSLYVYKLLFTDRAHYLCELAGLEHDRLVAMADRIIDETEANTTDVAGPTRYCKRVTGAVRSDRRVTGGLQV